jgi:phage host-nuclease inhibitor protein Gam
MPKKRKFAAAAIVLTSEDAMVGTLNRYIELSLKLARRKAKLDERIAALKTDFDSDNQGDREELAVLESSVQLFAVNHRGELFPEEKKSRDYANATIGFRNNPPSVGKLIPKDTFGAIALRLDAQPWGEPYAVWTCEPNKEALLRDRANLTPEQLAVAGIRFEQEEVFYIDPSSDAVARSKASVEVIKEKEAA